MSIHRSTIKYIVEYIVEKLENEAKAVNVRFSDEYLIVDLEDGRSISVPLMYYLKLYHGSKGEREHWTLKGEGIHWPELDEDICTADLLIGLPSAESQASLRPWLAKRIEKV